MISSPIRSQFEAVLQEQHLIDDLSTFAGPEYFDEVPLFSRYQQVEFLKQFGDVNLLVVELALDFLDRVILAVRDNRVKRFAAITLISDDGGKHLIPQIFVCSGDLGRRLSSLSLSKPTSAVGILVEDLVHRSRPEGGFSVWEDCLTVPDAVRVFVGYASPPHGLAALQDFATETRNES